MDTLFKLSPPYSLQRKSDNRGDSGSHMVSIDPTTRENYRGEVKEGCWIQVGSVTARSYSTQDWWMCTPIKQVNKISKNSDEYSIDFNTQNSEYILKGFNFVPVSEEVKDISIEEF